MVVFRSREIDSSAKYRPVEISYLLAPSRLANTEFIGYITYRVYRIYRQNHALRKTVSGLHYRGNIVSRLYSRGNIVSRLYNRENIVSRLYSRGNIVPELYYRKYRISAISSRKYRIWTTLLWKYRTWAISRLVEVGLLASYRCVKARVTYPRLLTVRGHISRWLSLSLGLCVGFMTRDRKFSLVICPDLFPRFVTELRLMATFRVATVCPSRELRLG